MKFKINSNTILKAVVLMGIILIIFSLSDMTKNVDEDKLLRGENPWSSLTQFDEAKLMDEISRFNSIPHGEKKDYINNFQFSDCLVVADYCIGMSYDGCKACSDTIQSYREGNQKKFADTAELVR